MRPPCRFELRVVPLREKQTIDCSRRVLAIGSIFFYPRSTFDLVMAGQRSMFGEIDVFSNLDFGSSLLLAQCTAVEMKRRCLK